jgi:endonuclease III
MAYKYYFDVFNILSKENPKPETELIYNSTFELLVAVILSAQATDISVNKATIRLFATANTPAKILNLGETKLREYIKSIGLYNSKAKNIIASCSIIINEYNNQVPCDREKLERLPGVGRKTANVILNTAFNKETIAVDTHIFRVGNRTGMAIAKDVLKVEHILTKNIPKQFLLGAHHWLILHGRYTCKAKSPLCGDCKIKKYCNWKDKSI